MSVQLNGFVVLYRKFRDWEWYTDSKTKAVFIELILSASFRDSSFQGYEVKRGSLVTSIHSLAVTLGLTDKEVRTALEHLKRTGEVAIKTTNKFSIITVKNYDLYQDEGKQEGKQKAIKRHAEGKQKAIKRHAEGKQKAIKGQHLNNVTKKQCNKETSGGVCLQGTHTPPREQNGATSVTPLGGEPSAPLTRREWRTYCEGKGQNEYKAAEEWIKVGGVFTEGQKKKVREWLKEHGEATAD